LLRARDGVVAEKGGLTLKDQADLAAGFQQAVVDILSEKTGRAILEYRRDTAAIPTFAVAGGVAANGPIRAALQSLCAANDIGFLAPPLSLCTDNAAMIAYAGLARFQAGLVDDMSLTARPRWPLDDRSPAMLGSGKKGAKA
jgi:N6-L-threonylcarbamoyladenine synthase